MSQIKFYQGTQTQFYEKNHQENNISYTTDTNRLYIGDSVIGESLDNLNVGRNNKINATKGRFGGALIGKDNVLGRMGYYIYPDWSTLSEDRRSVTVYFIDHQIGYYPEDVMVKMRKLAEQDNDDCLINNHVFSCGSTCRGWEHYANLVGYSKYSLEGGVAILFNSVYSDLSIYPNYYNTFDRYKVVMNKITYNVLNASPSAKYTSNDGQIEVMKSVTLTFDATLPSEDLAAAVFLQYAIPTDIWTNDWTLSNPENPQIGTFNIAEPTFAMGRRNKAHGSESFAIGRDNITKGDVSVALGVRNETTGAGSFAANGDNHSIGNWSATFGKNNWAEAEQAASFGIKNYAKAKNSITFGDQNTIESSGENSLASGYKNTITGVRAAAFGAENTAEGVDSFVAGNLNCAKGKAHAAIGMKLTTSDNPDLKGQVVVGAYNTSPLYTETYFIVGGGTSDSNCRNLLEVGSNNTTLYTDTTVYGRLYAGYGVIGVSNTTPADLNTFMVGDSNTITADGKNGFVSGFNCTVSKNRAVAHGANNTVDGVDAFAVGNGNTINIRTSAAIGKGLTTGTVDKKGPEGQVVVGAYNNPLDENTYFVVGTGTSSSKKHNMLVVSSAGVDINGSVEITGGANIEDDVGITGHASIGGQLEVGDDININNAGITIDDVHDAGEGIIMNRTRDGKIWTSAFYNSVVDSKTCGTAIRRSVDGTETNKIVITDYHTSIGTSSTQSDLSVYGNIKLGLPQTLTTAPSATHRGTYIGQYNSTSDSKDTLFSVGVGTSSARSTGMYITAGGVTMFSTNRFLVSSPDTQLRGTVVVGPTNKAPSSPGLFTVRNSSNKNLFTVSDSLITATVPINIPANIFSAQDHIAYNGTAIMAAGLYHFYLIPYLPNSTMNTGYTTSYDYYYDLGVHYISDSLYKAYNKNAGIESSSIFVLSDFTFYPEAQPATHATYAKLKVYVNSSNQIDARVQGAYSGTGNYATNFPTINLLANYAKTGVVLYYKRLL